MGITVHAKASAECHKCGSQRGNYQYCINCGHDSTVEFSAAADQPLSSAFTQRDFTEGNGEIDAFSSPEAKSLAEQLAALVVSQNTSTLGATPALPAAQLAVAEPSDSTTPPVVDPPATGHSRHAEPRPQHRHRLFVVAGVLALGLAGAGLARVLDQPGEGDGPSVGTLVSADDKARQDQPGATGRMVCWDGQTAFSLRGCGSPAGLTGLAWVFPSIEPEECEAVGSLGRPQAWSCPVTLRGRDATIVYGELSSVDDGFDQYNARYENGVGFRKSVESRYVWKATERNIRDVWQFSAMYVAEPWSVHVESATRKGAKLAFKSVEFRSPDELQGVVASD